MDVLQVNAADALTLQIVETVTFKRAAVIAGGGGELYELQLSHRFEKKTKNKNFDGCV